MANSFIFSGRVLRIQETQIIPTSSGKDFAKREFVVIVDGQYPDYRSFQCVQDKCDLLDKISVNDIVDVHFNAQGKQYHKNKVEKNAKGEDIKVPMYDKLNNPVMAVFNTDNCWKIEVVGRDDSYEPAQTKEMANTAEQNIRAVYETKPDAAPTQIDDKDDLPF